MKKTYRAAAAVLVYLALSAAAVTAYADTISDTPFGADDISTEVQETASQADVQTVPVQSVSVQNAPVQNAGQNDAGQAAPAGTGIIDIDSSLIDALPPAEINAPAAGEAVEASTAPAEASTAPAAVLQETAGVVQEAPSEAPPAEAAPEQFQTLPAESGPAEAQAPPAEAAPAPAETQSPAEDIFQKLEDLPTAAMSVPADGGIHTDTAGPGSVQAGSSQNAASQFGSLGSIHASDPRVRLDLGFSLVAPAVPMNGFRVAEGSVQLSDGSWDSIERGANIRYPYFKYLREQTDSTGTAWYIVAMAGRKVGDYATPDGSVPAELWLRKSDCTVQSSLDLNTSNETRRQIVRNAMALLGCRYRYAGNGPEVFDCSGFVHYVMESVGISVPRTSTELCGAGEQVGAEGVRPGDIVGRPGHVGIYIGDGYFVHASESSTGVITESIAVYERNNHFTNYVNVVGD